MTESSGTYSRLKQEYAITHHTPIQSRFLPSVFSIFVWHQIDSGGIQEETKGPAFPSLRVKQALPKQTRQEAAKSQEPLSRRGAASLSKVLAQGTLGPICWALLLWAWT